MQDHGDGTGASYGAQATHSDVDIDTGAVPMCYAHANANRHSSARSRLSVLAADHPEHVQVVQSGSIGRYRPLDAAYRQEFAATQPQCSADCMMAALQPDVTIPAALLWLRSRCIQHADDSDTLSNTLANDAFGTIKCTIPPTEVSARQSESSIALHGPAAQSVLVIAAHVAYASTMTGGEAIVESGAADMPTAAGRVVYLVAAPSGGDSIVAHMRTELWGSVHLSTCAEVARATYRGW